MFLSRPYASGDTRSLYHSCGKIPCFFRAYIAAVQVRCTGTEDRLIDCTFPEYYSDYVPHDDYIDISSDANEPGSAPMLSSDTPAADTALPPSNGLSGGTCSTSELDRVAVVCRSFEIPGETPPH